MNSADGNGSIDLDEVVAIKYIDTEEVLEEVLPEPFKRQAILPFLSHTFIVYMDMYGNGYSRIVY